MTQQEVKKKMEKKASSTQGRGKEVITDVISLFHSSEAN